MDANKIITEGKVNIGWDGCRIAEYTKHSD